MPRIPIRTESGPYGEIYGYNPEVPRWYQVEGAPGTAWQPTSYGEQEMANTAALLWDSFAPIPKPVVPEATPTPHPWDRPATGPLRQPEADWSPQSPEMQSWTGAFGRPDPGYWYQGKRQAPEGWIAPETREWLEGMYEERSKDAEWRRANLGELLPSPIPGFDPVTGTALQAELSPWGREVLGQQHVLPREQYGWTRPVAGGYFQHLPTLDVGERRYQPFGSGLLMAGDPTGFRHELGHATQSELWTPEADKRFWQSLPAAKTRFAPQLDPYPGQWGTSSAWRTLRAGPFQDELGFAKGAYFNDPREIHARLSHEPFRLVNLPESLQGWFPQHRSAPPVTDEEAAAMGWRYNPWESGGWGVR